MSFLDLLVNLTDMTILAPPDGFNYFDPYGHEGTGQTNHTM
jgi:hypothetical protein